MSIADIIVIIVVGVFALASIGVLGKSLVGEFIKDKKEVYKKISK